jgi:hypothetical protein
MTDITDEPPVEALLRVCCVHLTNAGGRSTVRGQYHDRQGRLVMSVAQELLIRPLDLPPQPTDQLR